MGLRTQLRSPALFAGRLRHRINICSAASTQDSTGGPATSTVIFADVWAAVENLTPGNDQLAAGEFISVTPTVVTIRYIGIAPSWTPITDYLGRALVVDANLNLQQAQSSGGLSGATAPAWNPETNGYTAGDGDPSTGVTWKNLGPASTRTGVRAGMLVTWNSKIFQIKSVNNPDNRSKMLILICTEINDSMQQSSTTGGTGSGYQNINLPPGGIDGGQF